MSADCTPSQNQTDTYPSDCEILEGYRARVREKSSRQPGPEMQRALNRAKEIKLLLLDVDGVLTDGTLFYSGSTEEAKSFNTQDGFGLRLLQEAGVDVGIITARKSEVVARRSAELKMRYTYQGAPNKNQAFKEIVRNSGLKPFQIAYMGDDWLDLVLLQQAGLALVPANGVPEVREVAHFITPRSGGCGAVRDACDLILRAQGKTGALLQKYRNR